MSGITVHIGLPKAASSSLQRALWDNREALADAGIAYPAAAAKNHNGAVADFLVSRSPDRLARRPHLADSIGRARDPGGWDRLLDELGDASRTILSSEFLAPFTPGLAELAVAELTRGDSQPPEFLLVRRRTSESWPSTYSQLAKDGSVLPFESWTRAGLATVLAAPHSPVMPNTRVAGIRACWSGLGRLREVTFAPSSAAAFEAQVLAALRIDHIVTRPFLGHRNASLSAARLIAWQTFQRLGGQADEGLLRLATRPVDEAALALPAAGGRFALLPETAELVDRAFPEDGEPSEQSEWAREHLRDRLVAPDPLTTTGLSAPDLAESVCVLVADLERLSWKAGQRV